MCTPAPQNSGFDLPSLLHPFLFRGQCIAARTTTHLSHARHASLNLPAASSATPTPWRASPAVATSAAAASAPPASALASPVLPSPVLGGSFRRPVPPAAAAAAPATEGESSPLSSPRARGGPPPSPLPPGNVPESGAEEAARHALYSPSAVSCLPSSSAWSARIWHNKQHPSARCARKERSSQRVGERDSHSGTRRAEAVRWGEVAGELWVVTL